jgi:hypothetical protein
MANFSIFVDVERSASRPVVYVPSPRLGGNLGVAIGIVHGADLWIRARGQDGSVRHEQIGETTYAVRAALPSGCEARMGPIVTLCEVRGRVATRDVGPLKALVNMLESRFWAFGEEGEVRGAAWASMVADGGREPAVGNAVAGTRTGRFEIPQLDAGAQLPPIDVPAPEVCHFRDVKQIVREMRVPVEEAPPHVVRGHGVLEALENGYPAGAHAVSDLETRHHVDIRFEVVRGAMRGFLRWTSYEGFDERSRKFLSRDAIEHDDAYKASMKKLRDLRRQQEARYDEEVDKLRSVASGLGAADRENAEIERFLSKARSTGMATAELNAGVQEIKNAYLQKKQEGQRHREILGELARRLRTRWEPLLPVASERAAGGGMDVDFGDDGDDDAAAGGDGAGAVVALRRKGASGDLTTPEGCFASMIDALRLGDWDTFQSTHSDTARLTLTKEGFERAVREIATQGPPEVAAFKGTESTKRIMLKSGRVLTRLRKIGGRWLNTYAWTK